MLMIQGDYDRSFPPEVCDEVSLLWNESTSLFQHQSSVKAQNLQEIAHFQSEGTELEWELVMNCPINSVRRKNSVGEKIGSILLLPFYQMSRWFQPSNDFFSQWVFLI